MTDTARQIVVCSCDGTIPLDIAALSKACGTPVHGAEQLCRKQIEQFRKLAAGDTALTIACTQEAPLFGEILGDESRDVTFANIRELAGWSREGDKATAKMAALMAAAAAPVPPVPLTSLESEGVTLIAGRDEVAIEVARRLAERLDITVILARPGEVTPPRNNEFPVLKGLIRAATGVLGDFTLSIDDFARPLPSSRDKLLWEAARNGATSRCDILIDLTGGPSLFPAADLRPGYLRTDPSDRAAVERLIGTAGDLVGTFDKPRYIDFTDRLCAHSRSQKAGCNRCADLCPTGAITPAGDHVAIDAGICAGCGSCASVCPTGAAAYAFPPVDAWLRRARVLITTYLAAGGHAPRLLVHDSDHGASLIDALARFGDGLPAKVLPLEVNEITRLGPEAFAAMLAWGAHDIFVLSRAKPKHDLTPLHRAMEIANRVAHAQGYGSSPVGLIETDDPEVLGLALQQAPSGSGPAKPASFEALGSKRALLELAFRQLHEVAPAPVARVELPEGAPFGTIEVATDGCTLCLACVSTCPSGALRDNPERPQLSFHESACVQCGLCARTCPEKVITLKPRIDFEAWSAARLIKQEEPFECIACGKPFGTRSSVERITAKLKGHWMYSGAHAKRLEVLMMCEDCRVGAMTADSFDPYGLPERPKPRTTDDYLAERELLARERAKFDKGEG